MNALITFYTFYNSAIVIKYRESDPGESQISLKKTKYFVKYDNFAFTI